MATIRPMRKSDLKDIEYICGVTAGNFCARQPILAYRTAKAFATYYVRECTDTCFCLADDNDKAVGYILCEPDYKRFLKIYPKVDARFVFSLDKKDGLEAFSLPIPYTIFGMKYPAHLHVDILKEYQSQGYGGKLMEALLDELKKRNVKGVMLTADSDNEGAIRFYERFGFKTLIRSEKLNGIVMAKKLS